MPLSFEQDTFKNQNQMYDFSDNSSKIDQSKKGEY